MSPQHSSPPERSKCTDVVVRTRTSLECMIIHYNVPLIYEFRSRKRGYMYSGYMKLLLGEAPHIQILFSSVYVPRIPDGTSPTVGGHASGLKSCASCRTQCIHTHSLSSRVKTPSELKRLQGLAAPPNPQRSFIFIQSNRKKRLPSPTLRAIPKASIPSGRKQFSSNFFRMENHVKKLVSARMQRPVNNNKVPK